jgi:hypothetical protein
VREAEIGVASRQELVAQMFLDDYLPGLAERVPLGSGGAFVAQVSAGRRSGG